MLLVATQNVSRRPKGVPRPAPGVALPILAVAGAVAAVLLAMAHGYGYHRDELYFLAAGRHLAWSYPDQGPLTPFVARVMSDIAPGSLTVLRAPSALMAGGCVVLSGLIAHEFGGSRRAQLIAAACTGAAPVVLSIGHLLSTSTYDVLAWALVTWLVCRALRGGFGGTWLAAGLVAGTALLNKPLIVLLLGSVLFALAVMGPREALRSGWPWFAGAVALAMWSPWLVWQAQHGWPQLHISSSIASGASASSQPRWALVPFQFLLAGPLLAPVWVAGLVGLLRGPGFRRYRWLALSWVILVAGFELTGGKPYYLGGLLPALFAAGAIEADRWLGRRRGRGILLLVAVLATAAVSAVIALPILPARQAGPAVAMNADVGETIGWPELVRQVAGVFAHAPKPAVILTRNYGEAGAVDRFGGAVGLPGAYSGHNGFGEWGPPRGRYRSVVTVGMSGAALASDFRDCRPMTQITNPAGIDNEENGKVIALCGPPREGWRALWPQLRHLS